MGCIGFGLEKVSHSTTWGAHLGHPLTDHFQRGTFSIENRNFWNKDVTIVPPSWVYSAFCKWFHSLTLKGCGVLIYGHITRFLHASPSSGFVFYVKLWVWIFLIRIVLCQGEYISIFMLVIDDQNKLCLLASMQGHTSCIVELQSLVTWRCLADSTCVLGRESWF